LPACAKSYKISKHRLTLPRPKKEMSDEKRQEIGERFKKMREDRANVVEESEEDDE